MSTFITETQEGPSIEKKGVQLRKRLVGTVPPKPAKKIARKPQKGQAKRVLRFKD